MTSQNSTIVAGSDPAVLEARGGHGLEIGDLIRIVSERRYIIIGAAVLGLVAAIAVSLLMTPLYRATALLEVNSPSADVIAEASGENGSASSVNSQELLATQLGLLQSDTLARRVVQDLNLVSRPEFGGDAGPRDARVDRAAAVLQANTLVESVEGSMLIRVSYSSPDAALAARVANALASGFISSGLERRYDSSSYARDFLSDQLEQTKTALEQSESALNTYAIRSGIFRTPGQVVDGTTTEGSSLAVVNLQALNDALNQARIKRFEKEEAYKRGGELGQGDAITASADLRRQRALLRAELQEKSRLFKSDYPEIQELNAQIAALDEGIRSESATALTNRRNALFAEYKAALEAERSIAQQVAGYKGDVQQERGRAIQYNILRREVDTNRALYDALLQRYKEIGVAGGIGKSIVSLVDQAEAPRAPYRPNLPMNATVGLLAGIVAGILLAVVAHLLFDNIVTPSDVRDKLGLPVIGVIPTEQGSEGSLLTALNDPKSDVSEAYFSVRTALRFADPSGPPKSVLITSARPGEGKSTSAYAIASIFARSGARVLLIDADLRKPTFVSRQSEGKGLAYLLGSDELLATYIEQSRTDNLSLLPVGRYSGSAAELLGSTRLTQIFEQAVRDFDMVVIDGPPVLGLADALLLGALAEKTVIAIESRTARTGNVSEMIRRLSSSGTNIAGVILTKVRRDSTGYAYYSYRYGSDDVGGVVSSDPTRALDVNA